MLALSTIFSFISEPGPFKVFTQYRWDDGGPWGHGMMNWGMGWAGGIMMMIFWIVAIIAVILFIRWLIYRERGHASFPEHQESPLDIVKKRYARGEINKEEFEQKKKDLS